MTGRELLFAKKMTGRRLFLRPKKSSSPPYVPINFAPSLTSYYSNRAQDTPYDGPLEFAISAEEFANARGKLKH